MAYDTDTLTRHLTEAADALDDDARFRIADYKTWRSTNPDAPSVDAIIRHFGSWPAATRATGRRPGQDAATASSAARRSLDNKAAASLRRAANRQPISPARYQRWQDTNPDAPTLKALCHRLGGSFAKACQTAGVEMASSRSPEERAYWLSAAAATIDEPVTRDNYTTWRDSLEDPTGVPRFDTTRWTPTRFHAFCTDHGIDCGETLWRYSDEALLAAVRDAVTDLGTTDSTGYQDWATANHRPARTAIWRRFGSWEAALELALA